MNTGRIERSHTVLACTGARTRRTTRLLLLSAAVMASAFLAGCREEEQDRILLYQKGVYQGPVDASLKDERVGDLRDRALNQRF